MKIHVDNLPVLFPYDYIYPEQYEYMLGLKQALDATGPCVFEMASGTGKTVALLSLIFSYQLAHPAIGKLLYCSRTVAEVEKVVEEVKVLIDYMIEELGGDAAKRLMCVALSSRRNLCVNEAVQRSGTVAEVDIECQKLTASWMRESAAIEEASVKTCPFYEGFERLGAGSLLPPGVYSLSTLRSFGLKHGACPYYLARHALQAANIIVFSFQYMLDPKIASVVTADIAGNSIVVFDEAHNIDNVCLGALSVSLTTGSLAEAAAAAQNLELMLARPAKDAVDRLEMEYQQLVAGLAEKQKLTDVRLGSALLPQDIREEAVPGNIRRAQHFVGLLRRCVAFLKTVVSVHGESNHEPLLHPALLRSQLRSHLTLDLHALGFLAERLGMLLVNLRVLDVQNQSLFEVCHFLDLLGSADEGFVVAFEPVYSTGVKTGSREIRAQLCCLDSSLAMRPVLKKYRSIVITSGTLSPLGIYPRLLGFTPCLSKAFGMSLHRDSVRPLIVTRGSDQVAMSSQYQVRENPAIVRNFGALLAQVCRNVPDGVVTFFPSYNYMQQTVLSWSETDILAGVLGSKLMFFETPDVEETDLAVRNYKKACDSGRGGLMLAVARGKLSEGVDFSDHYGRAVLVLGVPYQYTESRALQARVAYLRDKHNVPEGEFLSFDAMRTAAQCVGRAIRSKRDYGLLIFVDKRYHRKDKLEKLPAWIAHALHPSHMNLSSDMAVTVARRFLLAMSEPLVLRDLQGYSLLTSQHVAAIEKRRNALPE